MAHLHELMLKQQLRSYAVWGRGSQSLETPVQPTQQQPDAYKLIAVLTGARRKQDVYTREQRNAF